jgi:hypothetical protein
LAVTQSFFKNDALLFHVNIGYNYLRIAKRNDLKAIWGVGTQVHLFRGFHFVGEVFSGDPYVAGAGTAVQVGFRHFISDLLQLDMTAGKGFAGANPMPFWVTTGIRLVIDNFINRKPQKLKV